MGVFRGVELEELELTGARLLLRRWRADDADAVLEIMQDRSMYEFLALPDPYSRDTAQEFVTSTGHEGRGDGTGLGCAVVEQASGRLVGAAALRLSSGGDLGYWIRPSARGHGYAAEAVRLLVAWAFDVGVQRASLRCDVRNLASARVALASGFRFEGVERAVLPPEPIEPGPIGPGDLARFGRLATDAPDPVPPAFVALPAEGLGDGVVTLRATRPGDAAELAETEDKLAVGWNFTGVPRSLDAARRAAEVAGLNWLVGQQANLAIVDDETGRFAGDIAVRLAGPPQIGGIGYSMHPAFRGRGYTSRALRLLVPWAFETAGFARLELGAKAGNIASQRAAASGGFQPDGVREARLRNADGTFSDEVRFAVVNPKYR